jgi:Ca-activated chloride channel family protein
MRRAVLLGLLLLGAGNAQASDFWSSLWRSPDQRGEQLLRQGDAAAAARTFADPQRKAYAELQAGDYPAAARDFARFHSSDAHYNRGNALAHAGDLQAALKAYDAALARDPNNRDARHNRDLVAQALKQSKPPASSSQNQNSKQNPSKASNKGSGEDSNKGSGKGSGKDAGKGQNSGKDAGGSGPSSGDRQGGKPGQPQQAGKPGSKPGEQDQGGTRAEGEQPAKPASTGNGNPQPNPATGNDAEQARRDAEAGLGKQANPQANSQAGTGQDARTGSATRSGKVNAQRSEQQLAQEQWLRQIPDDPGGLLRRKFLIEHLMRQQGNQP